MILKFPSCVSNAEYVKRQPSLRIFGKALHKPNLWHLNRRSVARAVLIGLFWSLIPMPVQMIPAAASAIVARANVGLAVALVWITNPITFAPIYYGLYCFGRWLLGVAPQSQPFVLSYDAVAEQASHAWRPLYFGAIVMATALGTVGYVAVHVVWRWSTARRWRARGQRPPFRAGRRRIHPHAAQFMTDAHEQASTGVPSRGC